VCNTQWVFLDCSSAPSNFLYKTEKKGSEKNLYRQDYRNSIDISLYIIPSVWVSEKWVSHTRIENVVETVNSR
jgi:hypothetical protein